MFTRNVPPRTPGERRRGLSFIFVGLIAAYLILTALGTLWTDYLWFDSVGFDGVWRRRWTVGLGLGAAGIVTVFVVVWASLYVADRLAPRFFPRDLAEEEELVARFRGWSDGRRTRISFLVAAAMGIIVGGGVATWRDEFFLYVTRQDFGMTDPLFDIDVGFYVFQFPFLDLMLRWSFNVLVVATLLTALSHYLNGGIRLRRGIPPAFTSGAKAQLSLMLALLALIRAALYRMDSLALLYSDRQAGSFYGPGFTDITARLPAQRLLMAIAVVAAILFVVNIWRRGWTLVLVSVAGWILVSVAALLIYPAVVDRLQVTPQPLVREAEYISDNIRFTRVAYGLDGIEVRAYPATTALDASDIEANRLTVDNLRLWDTAVLPRTYQNLQEIRPYYTLEKVDTDRYMIEGTPTQTMVAVRELDEANLDRTDWQNTRLIYTHGLGAVVSQANSVEPQDGQPEFLLADLPPVTETEVLDLEQPRIYFGETYEPGRPVIVMTGSAPQEVDMPVGGEGIRAFEYDGDAGVELGNMLRRVAFAFRYRDLNLLISGQIRPDSRVLVQRNVRSIVHDLAPFLRVDSDPYPVVSDGRVMWVVDLYTASDHFPYSRPVTRSTQGRLTGSTDITPGVNYLSSSVKATVDAYNGTVSFYVVNDDDPVVQAWREVYPGLFQDGEAMPEQLQRHLRYPQDLFRIQGEMYLTYHVDEASEFFSGNDAWSIPDDPATIRRGDFPGADLLIGDEEQVGGTTEHLQEILPYFLLTKLPGEEELSYVLLQPFNPRDKPNMSSFVVADAPTIDSPGRLIDFRMPQGTLVGGTGQVGDRIQQNDEIAEQFTLWSQQGSTVIRGDMVVVPIEESLLYVQPIYLQAAQQGGFPEFRRVVVVFGDQIEWAASLDEALSEVFGTEEPSGTPVDPEAPPAEEPDGEVPSSVQELLNQAATLLESAEAALRAGDLGEYQRLVEEAATLIEEARAAGDPDIEAAIP